MPKSADIPEYLCLNCFYELAGMQVGQICPECGTKIRKLVNQAGLSKSKATLVVCSGFLSPTFVVIAFLWWHPIIFYACLSAAIISGVLSICYATNLKYAIWNEMTPIVFLRWLKVSRVSGWIGFLPSTIIMSITLGGLLIAYLINQHM
jgi:hypothetical protein